MSKSNKKQNRKGPHKFCRQSALLNSLLFPKKCALPSYFSSLATMAEARWMGTIPVHSRGSPGSTGLSVCPETGVHVRDTSHLDSGVS